MLFPRVLICKIVWASFVCALAYTFLYYRESNRQILLWSCPWYTESFSLLLYQVFLQRTMSVVTKIKNLHSWGGYHILPSMKTECFCEFWASQARNNFLCYVHVFSMDIFVKVREFLCLFLGPIWLQP